MTASIPLPPSSFGRFKLPFLGFAHVKTKGMGKWVSFGPKVGADGCKEIPAGMGGFSGAYIGRVDVIHTFHTEF